MAAPTVTDQEILKGLQAINKRMDQLERPASGVTKARSVFGTEWGPGPDQNGWHGNLVQQLSKNYSDDAVTAFLSKGRHGTGKAKGIGWGPALCKMAGLADPSLPYARGYTADKLEEEFGFVGVEKARVEGIKGPNGQVRKTALAEGSGLTGGYTIPPQFLTELLTIAAEDAFIEPRARQIPMNSRTLTLPMLDITTAQASGVSPYFGGVVGLWQPEATSLSESEPAFRQSEWTAWDLLIYSVTSNQLLMDNGVGLDALITQLFSAAITWYKEYAFLNGVGAGSKMPLGVINAPATYLQARAVSGSFNLADVAAMMSHLHIRSWDSACWIMHQSVLPYLIKMHDYTGSSNVGNHLVWLTPYGDGKVGPMAMKMPNAFFNGLPLYFTEKLPAISSSSKGDVLLVDWSQYIIGQRLDYQIDVSKDFLFRTNQLAWRVIARVDGKPWLNNSITDAAGFVSSPFVCLDVH